MAGLRRLSKHKNPRVRVQKRVRGIESERQAHVEEKRLIKELSEQLTKEEAKGSTWVDVIERWVRHTELHPSKQPVPTGCRSGELHQMKRSDVEVVSREDAIEQDQEPFDKKRYGFIRVRRSWNARLKKMDLQKPDTGGLYRSQAISIGSWSMI